MNLWLIGAGSMAKDYLKVLQALNVPCTVVGRGEESAHKLQCETGVAVVAGGVKNALASIQSTPDCAIVATGIEELAEVCMQLLCSGVKKILVEKPGGLLKNEIETVCGAAKRYNAEIFVAYNRRFYASVAKAQHFLKEDGGVTSFHFEFTI